MEHTSSPQPVVRRRSVSRHLVAALAIVAAITLLGGGVAVAQRGGARGHHPRPHVAGTVTAVSAPNFDIDRRNGEAATVITTADTKYSKTTDAAVADAVVGSYVVVHGKRSDDGATVAARRVHIRPAPPEQSNGRRPRGGTVVTNDGSTLTVKRADGSVVTVTTTADTKVRKTTEASFDDLAVGQFVHIGGTRNDDGTFAGRRVAIDVSTRPAKPEPKPASTSDDDAATVQGTSVAAAAASTADDSGRPAKGDAPRRRPAGSEVRVGGEIVSIEGDSFTLRNRHRTIVVHTTDATTYSVRNDDGTVTTGSFDGLEVGDRAGVAGTLQEDGSVTASKVVSGSPDGGPRVKRDGRRGDDSPDARDYSDARDDTSGGR